MFICLRKVLKSRMVCFERMAKHKVCRCFLSPLFDGAITLDLLQM